MQKKAFRIEAMLPPRRGADGQRHAEPAQQALHHGYRELSLLSQHGGERLRRAVGELDAVTADTETATQKVLDNVEAIDDTARTLAAALRNDNNQALAQDIQEHVTRIYEACNFQDLIGQRVTNALSALRMLEAQIAAVIAMFDGAALRTGTIAGAAAHRSSPDALLNGPPLPGAPGHTSQREIDRLFG